MNEYSELSLKLTKNLNKDVKKKQGIYFTPPKTINVMIRLLKQYINNNNKLQILEPSCGSCEYILKLSKEFDKSNITGIEYNNDIYNSILHYKSNSITLLNEDFMKSTHEKKYDLIVGNPPYFTMKKKEVCKSYYRYFKGKPNIFILFIIKCLHLLNDDGILGFVLPKSFLNTLNYGRTREYIYRNFQILDIMECRGEYIETKQKTIIFIVKKTPNIENDLYTMRINDMILFNTKNNIGNLKKLHSGSVTLSSLGFKVTIGTVVWNQCKDILTSDSTKTRLIYSGDVNNGMLKYKTYKNPCKQNFINKNGDSDKILILSRGYGIGNYNLDYAIVDVDYPYLVENHLMRVIYDGYISESDLDSLYNKIIKSLSCEKTKKFIDICFGNNAINTTEIMNIVPIYL